MSKKNCTLIGFILLKFIIQYLLISPQYDLHRDEYLHLDQGHHLAWGYLSVPPVTSWISRVILLLGNGVFWVKFFPALFGALTILVVWKIIEKLGGSWFALLLGTSAVLFSALLRINILYQPNSLDILLWTLFYSVVISYIQSENKKWLYTAALIFGIGFLNKYNIVFLILGMFPAMLLTPQRKIFLLKDFYLAMGISVLIILPNLIWQFTNAFPVFRHLKELASTQLVNVERSGFLKEQIIFFFGSLFIFIAAFVSLFQYEPFRKFRLFFWSFLSTLMIFIYFRAKGYYAIGLYPVLVAFGAAYLEHLLTNGWKIYLRPVLLLIPPVLFIPFLRIAFPNISPEAISKNSARYKALGLLRWEDGEDHVLPQDFADMLGWKELAAKVDNAYFLSGNTGQTLILCDNYGEAGAINYYSKNKNIQAVSMSADYINWFPFDKQIRNIVVVKVAGDSITRSVKAHFQSANVTDSVTNPYAVEHGTSIFLLENSKIDVNMALKKMILQKKRAE